MSKLTIVRGISGSGKSTWAKQQNAVVVSRDNIRHGTMGVPPEQWYSPDVSKEMRSDWEDTVTRLQDASVVALLRAGKDVIVDNTNIEWKFVKALANIGYANNAEVEVKVFDVDFKEAVMRDTRRGEAGGRQVGEEVIMKQYNRFQQSKSMQLEPVQTVKPYNGTPGKPKAFLVDIDGTLAHMTKRGPFDWKRVGEDDVVEVISDLTRYLANPDTSPYIAIVMSGRDAVCRPETQKWLSGLFYYQRLFMRPEGDMRKDNIVKAELFDKYVRNNFDVQFVLDDRDQVVKMWRSMGLTCLQVAEGAF